jgi:hypothetical protein
MHEKMFNFLVQIMLTLQNCEFVIYACSEQLFQEVELIVLPTFVSFKSQSISYIYS